MTDTAETNPTAAARERQPVTEFATADRTLSAGQLTALVLLLISFPILVFFSPLGRLLVWAPRLTAGLVSATMAAYLLVFAGLWCILRIRGGLRLRDIGLHSGTIRSGLLITLVMWLLTNGIHAVAGAASGHALTLHPDWQRQGVLTVIGTFLGQLLGNALCEEIVYRHVLITQLMARAKGRLKSPAVRLALVLLVTQAAFAAVHIPHRLRNGLPPERLPGNLFVLLLMGLIYSWGYLQTRNLVFVVGWHSLSNTPTLLVPQAVGPHNVLYGIIFVGLMLQLGFRIVRRMRSAHRLRPGGK